MIRKGMAVVTAAGQEQRRRDGEAVDRGMGRMGAGLGGDLIFEKNSAAGVQAVRVSVLRWRLFRGGDGRDPSETGAIVLRGYSSKRPHS
jgi:hypothetical protein